jgi:hypothetical protein
VPASGLVEAGLPSGLHPDHARQHGVALDEMVTQGADQMHQHQRGEQVWENHVGVFEQIVHEAILARLDQRHLQPERILLVDPSPGAGEVADIGGAVRRYRAIYAWHAAHSV